MSFSARVAACRIGLLGLICTWPLLAGGTLTGTIQDQDGKPIAKAQTLILSLNRAAESQTDGTFLFKNVPAGEHRVQISHNNFGHRIKTVTVQDQQTTTIAVTFDLEIHEAMTISASPIRKSIADVAQAVGVLNEDDLLRKGQVNLGDTLSSEPGVAATAFGQGAGRPIIRGLGGDRIRILEGGIGSGDVSTVSPDHAVSIDPSTIERIEILRGPASLRYGGNAVGGIVNIIDNRIPEFIPTDRFGGSLELSGDQATNKQSLALSLNGAASRFAYHIDWSDTQTDDYDIPEAAERDSEEPFTGVLENSSVENRKGNLGVSYIHDRGFFGVSVTDYQSDYQVPGHHHHEDHDDHDHDHDDKQNRRGQFEEDDHGDEEEESVTIDLDQNRYDARGELRFNDEHLKTLNLRAGYSDYEHRELEGDTLGTTFLNSFYESRLELVLANVGPFSNGSVGLHHTHRDFEAFGAEAFVPENKTETLSGFVYGEIERSNWSLVVGSRFGRQTNKTSAYILDRDHDDHDHDGDHDDHDGDHDDHDDDHDDHDDDHDDHDDDHDDHEMETAALDLGFNGLSGSVGFVYGKQQPFSFAANATFTERAPTAEELFSFGPHLATNAFEIGDANLTEETSLGVDLLLRKREGVVTGELSLFRNRFDDYIYQYTPASTDLDDELVELFYTQDDATFWGGELHLDFNLYHTDPHHLHFEVTYDYVRGERSNGENLPRMTPSRLNLALEYSNTRFWIKGEGRITEKQDRVALNETVTDGYTMLNLSAGYHLLLGKTKHQLVFNATNLSDEAARVHTSVIKDRVLLPGRSISAAYKVFF